MWQRLLNKTITKTSLMLDLGNCLRQRYKNHECNLCQAFCPEQAITLAGQEVTLDKSRCTGCGLCCHLCPTQAFHTESERLERISQTLLNNEAACFTCRKQGNKESDILLPCLQALSPELLMLAFLKKMPVQIYWAPESCNTCNFAFDQEGLLDWIKEWNRFGGQALRVEIIHNAGLKKSKFKDISRRDFFSFTKKQLGKQVKSLFTESDQPDETPLKDKVRLPGKREYVQRFLHNAELQDKILPGKLAEQLRLCTIGVTENCTICDRCAILCPTGALCAESMEGQRQLTFDPVKCLDCGICSAVCPQIVRSDFNVLKEWDKVTVIKRTKTVLCPQCGGPMYQEDDLCQECRLTKDREEELIKKFNNDLWV